MPFTAPFTIKMEILFFQGLVLVKPVVFGNKSQYFGKKRETDGHTHWWNVYVKPFDESEVRTLQNRLLTLKAIKWF